MPHVLLRKAAAVAVVVVAVAVVPYGVQAHGGVGPINPQLGVPGFPDCVQPDARCRAGQRDVDACAASLVCTPRPKTRASQTSIACVGDSITAGVHSTGGNATYPAQLQLMLGNDYVVTNLGACGATMLRHGNSPYWQRPQFKALASATWDVVVIMLGTNDSKDVGDGGPANWPHNCTGAGAHTCPYADDYATMLKVVRGLGPNGTPPNVFVAIPPPLMLNGVYGMNQTVINDVLPVLIPVIASDNQLTTRPISIFAAFDGGDAAHIPPAGCTPTSTFPACPWYCDTQSCDQCHPNNDGYHRMAQAMKAGLGV